MSTWSSVAPPARLVTVVGAVLLLAGCGGSGSVSSAASTAPSVATESLAPTGTPADASPSASSEPAPSSSADVSGPAGPAPSTSASDADVAAAVVKDIRVADHGTFDRVVVEFTGSFGSWTVGYVDKVVNDPEGGTVALKGSAFVAVRIQKATFDNLFQVGGGITHIAYQGPHRIAAGLTNVKEIADAGDFEAVMGLGIGVDHAAGLRAYRLESPTRLVVDIAH